MRWYNGSAWCSRVKSVPLVCGRWYRIMADASMWSAVDAQPRGDQLVRDSPHAKSMVTWLQQRGPKMRELTLRASDHCCVCPVPDAELLMQTMPACYLAIISAEW
jgi:hypothetical protein